MTSEGLSTFGALLRRYRLACGLTQEALAERAQISAFTISALERGVNQRPRVDTLDLLATALALSTQDRAGLLATARRLASTGPATTPAPHPLIGRGRELALLEAHLAGEEPPVLLLAGQPGIGKSRLLQEAARQAQMDGWQVLAGGCQRRGGQQPYAPLLEAIERHLHGQSPAQLRVTMQGCAWLVRLLPELAGGPIEPLPAWTLPPDQERRLLFRAVARFLANVAGPAGTLLLLDDLQWAGPDVLDLLAALVRSAPEAPLRVVGAYRDTDVQQRDPLSGMLADLAHAGLATHHTLGPLTAREAGQLLDGLLGGAEQGERAALREQVVQRVGGVPFFLISCAPGLRAGEVAGRYPADLPWDVEQSIRQRVAGLPDAAQALLGVAAVAGRVAPRALLLAAAKQPEPAVLAGLDAACRAQLLEETEADAYRFAHDVIREVVEADLGLARRAVLHRRVAMALEQRPGAPPVEALAYHWARGGEDERAVPYLEQAGDQAQFQRAHAAAEGYYRDLVACLDRLGHTEEAASACEKLGAVLTMLSRYAEALAVLERAAGTYRAAGDWERVAQVTAQIGRLHGEMAMPEQGIQLVQPLVAQLVVQGPSPGLAALYLALADLFDWGSRYSEKAAAAERAAAVARALRDDGLLAMAEGVRGSALETMGHIEEGLRVLQEALRLREATGELISPSDIDLLQYTATASLERGRFAEGLRYMERALGVSEQLGDPRLIAWMLGRCSHTRLLTGDWERARTDTARAAGIDRQLGFSIRSTWVTALLATLHRVGGAEDEAIREFEAAIAMAERSGDQQILQYCQSNLAEIEIGQGRPAAACARLLPLLKHPGLERQHAVFVLPRLAQAYLELGDTGRAGGLIQQAVEFVRATGDLLSLAEVLWVQALVITREGGWAEAHCILEESLSLTRSMPYPYMEARTLQVYGDLHRQKSEPEPAREKLEAALAIFRRLDARKDSEQVERTLMRLTQP
jgi:tetratricopeptide (TPR) repeat protein/transcriptional regulator with XRE-family HTH domain